MERRSLHKHSATRRGVALLLVLMAVAVSATLAMSFLSAQSTSIGIARNIQNHSPARYVAESGLELAVAYIRANSNWRTVQSDGAWVTDEPFAGGTFTLVGEDGVDTDGDGTVDGDGDLSDDTADLLTLTVTGEVNGAAHMVRAVVTPRGEEGELVLRPTGVGSSTALVGSGSGSGNWDRVNEETPDDNATYVASSGGTSYETDTYATQDSGMSSGSISSVTLHIRVRKGSGGSKVKTVLRTGGADCLGSQINLNSTTYSDHSTAYSTNPATGAVWTWAEIDAMEIGVTSRKGARCTQIYADVQYTGGGGGSGNAFDIRWDEQP